MCSAIGEDRDVRLTPFIQGHFHKLPIAMVSRGMLLRVASVSEIAFTISNHSLASPSRLSKICKLAKLLRPVITAFTLSNI
jgi:hypothetical protein